LKHSGVALGTIPTDAGIAEPPQFMPAHTVYIQPRSLVVACQSTEFIRFSLDVRGRRPRCRSPRGGPSGSGRLEVIERQTVPSSDTPSAYCCLAGFGIVRSSSACRPSSWSRRIPEQPRPLRWRASTSTSI
jgi:hypothetical protein